MKKVISIIGLILLSIVIFQNANSFVGMQKVYYYNLSDDYTETNTGGGFGTSTDGYDDTQISVTSGTVNPDHSPAILGNQDLQLSSDAVARYGLGTNLTDFDVSFIFKSVAIPASSQHMIELQTADGSIDCVDVFLKNDGTLRIFDGAVGGSGTVGTVTAGTSYIIFIHGNTNGSASMGFTPYTGTQIRPIGGNNFDSVSGGDGTNAMGRVRLVCPTGITNYIDHLRVLSNGYIPNNPL